MGVVAPLAPSSTREQLPSPVVSIGVEFDTGVDHRALLRGVDLVIGTRDFEQEGGDGERQIVDACLGRRYPRHPFLEQGFQRAQHGANPADAKHAW